MATKQEIAEGLTMEELRSLADEHGIDVAGASNKTELVDLVVAGATKDQLEAYADVGPLDTTTGDTPPPVSDAETSFHGGAVQEGAPGEGDPLPGLPGSVFLSPEEAAERGVSAADLELATPLLAGGAPRIIKSFPERQSVAEVEVATEEQPGFPEGRVTITDGDGNEVEAVLRPDEAARVAVAAAPDQHPAHQVAGHYSNPNLTQWGDDEEARRQNEEAYAERIGA